MYKHKVQSFKHCEKQRLTDQQLSSSIFPCCPVLSRPPFVTSPIYDVLDHTNHIFSESSWSKDIKIDIITCLTHKYTNTAEDKVPERPNMWYFFEKRFL